ncbi:MAG TPA: acylphosphatase [Stellaceae bacterium]|nr:acylphosphatase [Stellaceae bacterium]
MKTVRLTMAGTVQGVGYRIWAERTALQLGLRGWVRNRADGSVELLATGDDDAIAALVKACWRGPRPAEVSEVTVANAEDDGSTGFGMRPTV